MSVEMDMVGVEVCRNGGGRFLHTGPERNNLSGEERCHLHCEHTLITAPLRPLSIQHSITPIPLLRSLTRSISGPSARLPAIFFISP